ncbi:nucleoside-diphosphate kinase [Kutzneria sp. CA-103260]|uniref:nucleoside-diphosphate kinase n=1 Tax=Kutzneria sp. CA-103260 TaxID=2802641 RepID=UPI001BA4E20E|nr:nucleoside-diphosphate kinase [Kutzneria sp. CA-103260]QUQ63031.1 Nucleoside diphosphate kinase [Kutzneria sp. CA-103260]
MRGMHGPVLSESLSRNDRKRELFGADTYFQESLDQLAELTTDPEDFAYRHGLLLLKPDAVVSRQLLTTVDWLARSGFTVVAATKAPLTPTVVRSLWYFQWNLATAYRRRIADLFTMTVPALLLVIRKDGTDRPVSTLLTELKGPTDPDRRRPGELRYELGKFSFLLNLVHTADEPADVIRELGVHLDYATRGEVLREALAGVDNSARARALAEKLYAAAPARDLSFEPAAERLRAQAGRVTGPAQGELQTSLAVPGDEGLRALLRTVWRHGLALDPWDVTVVGSTVFPMKDKTFEPVIAAVTAADWQPAAAGR